jgi:precorrin-2 dehydrogenase/sirohydrochlorin ferrochelatase
MSFPVALELAGRWCLVVGDGAEAEQRISQFKARGAYVRWIYSEARTTNTPQADQEQQTPFACEHLQDVWVAVLTERNALLAAELQALCEAQRIWFCAVDQPSFNSFSHVAQVVVEPLVIGISSAGRAPLLSRRVREGLQALFDSDRIRTFFQQLAELRANTPPAERKNALTQALQGFAIVGKVVLPGDPDSAAPTPVVAAEKQR